MSIKIFVHHGLECRWWVAHPKEHYCWFEESSIRFKGSFPLVSISDPNIVVSPAHVQFSESFCSFEFVEEFTNQGKGIGVLDRMFIEISVILAWSKLSILLIDEEERWCHLGFRWSDIALFEVVLEEFFQFDIFFRREMVRFEGFWFECVLQFDFMVPFLRFGGIVPLFLQRRRPDIRETPLELVPPKVSPSSWD